MAHANPSQAETCLECATVGAKIKEIRESGISTSRLSQKDMAEELGMTAPMYSWRERGKLHWDWCEIVAVADILGVKVADLTPDPEPTTATALRVIRKALSAQAS